MTMPVGPNTGGFQRFSRCGWFVPEFLLGRGPRHSARIDPEKGAPISDIHSEYKMAIHRDMAGQQALDAQDRRIRKGLPAFTEEEFEERRQHYLERIPYKLTRARYSSFTRYMDHLNRLGWIERTGYTEPSAVQDFHPPAPPRVYYRLTESGRAATDTDWGDPIMALYHYTRTMRSAKRHSYYR